jgi:hypothetical protein
MQRRPIRQIAKVDYAQGHHPLVSLEFSRSDLRQDRMFLRFESEKAGFDFVTILQSIMKLHIKVVGREP